jgi:hypothetical protein
VASLTLAAYAILDWHPARSCPGGAGLSPGAVDARVKPNESVAMSSPHHGEQRQPIRPSAPQVNLDEER